MLGFNQLEQIAAAGGYEADDRDITRITVARVHILCAALTACEGDEAQQALVAAARLRRWIVHGDGLPPPVRGAGYLHSNREVWMAYVVDEDPAMLRGRASALAELRTCLALAVRPDYDASLRVKTDPRVSVEKDGGDIVLRSTAGGLRLNARAASYVEHWISASMRPKDKRGVLLLPGQWLVAAPAVARRLNRRPRG